MRSLSAPAAVVAIAVVIIVVGWAASLALQAQVFSPPSGPARKGVAIYVGEPGSTSYIVGERLASLLRSRGIEAYIVSSDPVTALSKAVSSNNTFAIVTADLAYLAYHGLPPFGNNTKELPRALASLYTVAVQIAARSDTGIKTISDLENHTLAAGTKNSHVNIFITSIMKAAGVKPVYIYIDMARAVEYFRLARIDALATVSGVPDPAIYQLSTVLPLNLVQIPFSQVADKLREEGFTFIKQYSIPAGTYQGQTRPVETIAVNALLVTSKNSSEDLVGKILDTLISYRKQVFQGLAEEKTYNATAALEGVSIPLHLGAARYYLKAGVNVPGTLLPPEIAGGG